MGLRVLVTVGAWNFYKRSLLMQLTVQQLTKKQIIYNEVKS